MFFTDRTIKIYFHDLISVGKPRRFSSLEMKTWLCLQSGKKTTLQSENSHLKLESLQQNHADKLRRDEKKKDYKWKCQNEITFVGRTPFIISKYDEYACSLAHGWKFENMNLGEVRHSNPEWVDDVRFFRQSSELINGKSSALEFHKMIQEIHTIWH
jgi:hypothetical protein